MASSHTGVLLPGADSKSYRVKSRSILLYVLTAPDMMHNQTITNMETDMNIKKSFTEILKKDRVVRFLFGGMVLDGLMVISLVCLAIVF
jgi:hypothetical protein